MTISSIKKLIAYKMSLDAIPKGGNIMDGLEFLLNPEKIKKSATESQEWVKSVIEMMRKAAEPNPFKNSDDEEIAAEILRKIEDKKYKKE